MTRIRAAVVATVVAATAVGTTVAMSAGTAGARPAAHTMTKGHRAHKPKGPREPVSYESTSTRTHAREVVEWRNPHSKQLRRIVVRIKKGAAAPKTIHSGHGVHLHGKRAHRATLSKLALNKAYSVSVFAVYRNGRVSRPAVTRFTTPARAEAGKRVTVRGAVTDTVGHPLRGATIWGFSDTSDLSRTVQTNVSGQFVLGVAPGSWSFFVDGPTATGGDSDATGYSAEPLNVEVGARTVTAPTLRLPAGAKVTGRIVDTHGRPVAGAWPYAGGIEPYLQSDSWGVDDSDVSDFSGIGGGVGGTDPDGRFELRGLPAGQAFVLCASGENARVGTAAVDLLSACAKRSKAVAGGQSSVLPDFTLRTGSGVVVTGHLRSKTGRPLSGGVQLRGKNNADLFAYVDDDGTYRLPGVPKGRYQACGGSNSTRGSRTGYASTCGKTFTVGGTSTRADVALDRGAAASGTVTGPGGRRLPGVEVMLSDDEDGYGYVTSDGHGQWRIVGLDPGTYTACYDGSGVSRPVTGVRSSCADSTEITVRRGRVRSGVDRRLTAAAALSGVLRDTTGKPVAHGYVAAQSSSSDDSDFEDDDGYGATTDAHGHYRVVGLDPGRYTVCGYAAGVGDGFADDDSDAPASDQACAPAVRVRIGATTAVAPITVAPATAISVHVTDASGTPVAGVDAAALSRCTEVDCQRTTVLPDTRVDVEDSEITDAAGVATLAVDPGRYAVCGFAFFGTTVQGGSPTGYADACPTGFATVVAKHTTATVAVSLADGGEITGRLTDKTGHAVANAHIVVPGSAVDDLPGYPFDSSGSGSSGDKDSLSGAQPSPTSANDTDGAGRFSVIGVRPGTWPACAVDRSAKPRFASDCAGGKSSPGVVVTADATTNADIVVTLGR